ncbi:hypothetical protein Peur_064840 [Populus x canadensis]
MVKDEIRAKETILCGKCPDLKIRHHFGRKAVKGALFIAEIREETVDFTTVSYQAATEVHFARIQRCGIYNAGFECLGGIWNGRDSKSIAQEAGGRGKVADDRRKIIYIQAVGIPLPPNHGRKNIADF